MFVGSSLFYCGKSVLIVLSVAKHRIKVNSFISAKKNPRNIIAHMAAMSNFFISCHINLLIGSVYLPMMHKTILYSSFDVLKCQL